MKASLALAVSVVALAAAAPAAAHEPHACIDDGCTMVSLIEQGPPAGATTDTGGTPLHYRLGGHGP